VNDSFAHTHTHTHTHALEREVCYNPSVYRLFYLCVYVSGGIVYYDAQHNDARMALGIALTAGTDIITKIIITYYYYDSKCAFCISASKGAVVANHIEVLSLIRDPRTNRVCGAHVHDLLNGDEWDVCARVCINACGPFSDSIRHMADSSLPDLIVASSGVHVVLADRYSPAGVCMCVHVFYAFVVIRMWFIMLFSCCMFSVLMCDV